MANTKAKSRVVKLGYVGVDSGILMVCDPCYIDSIWQKGVDFKDEPNGNRGAFNYDGACKAAHDSPDGGGQLFYPLGHSGVGVAFHSGFGDGYYGVYAKIVDYGEYGERIQSVTIRLIKPADVKVMKQLSAESDKCSCCDEQVNLKEVQRDSFTPNSEAVNPEHPSKGQKS